MNVCRKMGWWLIESDIIGEEVEASVGVDWTVYSRLERRMVLRTSTRGYTAAGAATEDGKVIAVEQAMAGAIANLAADPDFQAAAASRGVTPIFQSRRLRPAAASQCQGA